MKKIELVFIPVLGRGHLVSMAEFVNKLLSRDDRFSATILVIPFEHNASDSNSSSTTPTSQLLATSDADHIQYIDVPKPTELPPLELMSESPEKYFTVYLASHKSQVKDIIVNRFSTTSSSLSGLVVDFFCSAMNDVAQELGIPFYVFLPSGAGFLGFMLYLQTRHLHDSATEFEESDPESDVPSYTNPIPTWVLPSFAFNKRGGYASFVDHATEIKKAKGIIVNTVQEFESHAVESFVDGVTPPVYTIGPIIDLNKKHSNLWFESNQTQRDKIMRFLDSQPPKSVVFLCFGSTGSFDVPQLIEIAIGLERSGQRFLWSVRRAPPQGKFLPKNYEDPDEFLPKGFLERTKGKGILCGWAPQVEVLAHQAIGGFVSHCGWNSILESLWFGVPIATWPMYAEQQINAFQLVKDLGLAVELRLDYRKDSGDLVRGDEIKRAIGCLMDGGDDGGVIRKRVEEMSGKCRRAVVKGGSSFESFGRLIDAILANVS